MRARRRDAGVMWSAALILTSLGLTGCLFSALWVGAARSEREWRRCHAAGGIALDRAIRVGASLVYCLAPPLRAR